MEDLEQVVSSEEPETSYIVRFDVKGTLRVPSTCPEGARAIAIDFLSGTLDFGEGVHIENLAVNRPGDTSVQ